ncbi:MAG: hypothetical protein U1F35_07260 [Steroidobacteraceae bacterium]
MFRHWHRLRSVLFLAIALQFAQVGAMAHALSHDPSRLRLPDRVALHASLCGECATFGAVLTPGAAPSMVEARAAAPTATPVASPACACISSSARHHFEAQGPPAPA